MEYHYSQKQIWNQPGSILEYIQQVDICNKNNLMHLDELISLVKLSGMKEIEGYLQKSIADPENSQLWIKMALSALQDGR